MDVVDITNVPKDLFVTLVFSLLIILSLLSVSIVRFFQRKYRSGSILMVVGLACIAALVYILNEFFA